MTDREQILGLAQQLADEVQRLHMAQTVQHSAYVVLVHHLQHKGLVHLPSLEKSLHTMAETQPDADWQSGHEEIADAIALLKNLPAKSPKAAAHHGY